ncbi:8989_t:CDS:2 [Dentiscutata erythropus]|uniref:8989_t:CDS:1 n=1 Tax=Dentiscutata erythropus TaxID=1348616 RepID=A0A9N8W4Q2_9GLOM|nr:8989_t:CDS:2 [Dentiscutata erythropus]
MDDDIEDTDSYIFELIRNIEKEIENEVRDITDNDSDEVENEFANKLKRKLLTKLKKKLRILKPKKKLIKQYLHIAKIETKTSQLPWYSKIEPLALHI